MKKAAILIISLFLLICPWPDHVMAQGENQAPPSVSDTQGQEKQPTETPPPSAADPAVALFNAFSAKLDLYHEMSFACQSLSENEETADVREGCSRLLKNLSNEIQELWGQVQALEGGAARLPSPR